MAVNIQVLAERLRQARDVLGYSIEQASAETGIESTRQLHKFRHSCAAEPVIAA